MPLFRPIPPPSRDAPFQAQIDWAARRDPIGHQVHLWLACAALALIPLSSTLATIGSTILFGYAALRTPTIRRTWRQIPQNACMITLVALYVWLATSLAWSSDPDHGARLLRGSRYLLLVPALLPLLRHARILLAAICTGVFVQVTAQWLIDDGTGGLSEHAGFTALWFSMAAATLVLMPASGRSGRLDLTRKFLAPIPMIGIVVSTARSALLGCTAGLIAGMTLALRRNRGNRKAMVVSGIAVIATGAILTLNPSTPINKGVQEAIEATSGAEETDIGTYPDQVRPLWWRIGLDAFKDQPLTGQGLGSAGTMIADDEEVQDITQNGTTNLHAFRDDYHSSFVTVMAEGGLVGSLLFTAWIVLLTKQVITRGGELDAVLLAGLASFLVFSMLNTTLFSGRLVAFAAILMAISTQALPRQSALKDAVREAE
ncbi:MAG: O-antigen ligase family protein [Phycisphaerales bacterium]|nr:O-antigen ligase family protein [Phycisphaerales bacterium]